MQLKTNCKSDILGDESDMTENGWVVNWNKSRQDTNQLIKEVNEPKAKPYETVTICNRLSKYETRRLLSTDKPSVAPWNRRQLDGLLSASLWRNRESQPTLRVWLCLENWNILTVKVCLKLKLKSRRTEITVQLIENCPWLHEVCLSETIHILLNCRNTWTEWRSKIPLNNCSENRKW